MKMQKYACSGCGGTTFILLSYHGRDLLRCARVTGGCGKDYDVGVCNTNGLDLAERYPKKKGAANV